MPLTESTKIDDLLREHPFLEDYLVAKSPRYRMLKNPVMRATMGKVATLERVAQAGGFELAAFIADLEAEIARHAGAPAGAPKADRLHELRKLLLELHRGGDPEDIRERVKPLIEGVDPTQIVQIGQSLVDAGVPETEVKALSEIHSELFRKALEGVALPDAAPGHPVHTHMRENRAAEDLLGELESVLEGLRDPRDEQQFPAARETLLGLVKRLSALNTHYHRKEHQLFPLLEARGLSGPPQVMWAAHDEIRAQLRKTAKTLEEGPAAEAGAEVRALIHSVREMIYKEARILFPMCLDSFTDEDWAKVRAGEAEIGFAWIEPHEGGAEAPAAAATTPSGGGRLRLSTGELTVEQLDLMLTLLPVEVTLVDENDRVAYYSNAPERIFPRSPGIIGRQVQRCHPPQSVARVVKILEDFRAGRRQSAEFWLRLQERFVHIRYFALRNADGTYLGTMEVAQDVTGIRSLTGERRLLDEGE